MVLGTDNFLSNLPTGDNFFSSANYTIEALCAAPFRQEKENLRNVEAQLLSKRAGLMKFEPEYREVSTSRQAGCHGFTYIFIKSHVSFLLNLGRFWHTLLI